MSVLVHILLFFFSSRRRHTRWPRDWSSDVCSSDLDFHPKENNGYLITNPPYGERLNNKPEVDRIYQDLGKTMMDHSSWSVYVLTSNKKFENLYGKKATKRRKLFNGFIEVDYYQYFGKFIKKD